MASWNSLPLEITYQAFGWIAFISWSISFYPQVILNFRRKSVVGLNFDFVVLNLLKHSSYLIYNATLYFSKAVQTQYYEKYGFGETQNLLAGYSLQQSGREPGVPTDRLLET